FFSSRRRHTRFSRDWSSDVCSSDLGYRYDGNPGQANYRAIQYDTYGVLLPKPEVSIELSEREALPTSELFGSDDIRLQTELQWRSEERRVGKECRDGWAASP